MFHESFSQMWISFHHQRRLFPGSGAKGWINWKIAGTERIMFDVQYAVETKGRFALADKRWQNLRTDFVVTTFVLSVASVVWKSVNVDNTLISYRIFATCTRNNQALIYTVKSFYDKWLTRYTQFCLFKLFYPVIGQDKFWNVLHYKAVLVSKLRAHFIVLILHFMLYFSHLILNQLHFHTVLRIDSENSFCEGTMVFPIVPHFLRHNVPLFNSPSSFYEGHLVLLIVCYFLMHKSHHLMVSGHFTKQSFYDGKRRFILWKSCFTHEYVRAAMTYPRSLCCRLSNMADENLTLLCLVRDATLSIVRQLDSGNVSEDMIDLEYQEHSSNTCCKTALLGNRFPKCCQFPCQLSGEECETSTSQWEIFIAVLVKKSWTMHCKASWGIFRIAVTGEL